MKLAEMPRLPAISENRAALHKNDSGAGEKMYFYDNALATELR